MNKIEQERICSIINGLKQTADHLGRLILSCESILQKNQKRKHLWTNKSTK